MNYYWSSSLYILSARITSVCLHLLVIVHVVLSIELRTVCKLDKNFTNCVTSSLDQCCPIWGTYSWWTSDFNHKPPNACNLNNVHSSVNYIRRKENILFLYIQIENTVTYFWFFIVSDPSFSLKLFEELQENVFVLRIFSFINQMVGSRKLLNLLL